MDKKKGLLNISISIFFKMALLVVNILVRRFVIQYIGNEINGLNSLYISILDFLAVAELGVGSAITFCMYKPIVNGETEKVSALYGLFNKLYLIIGLVIGVSGCLLMPVLPFLAKEYRNIDVNLYLTFGMMLVSVVLTYFFSAKTSLINAYKDNYITTSIYSLGLLFQCILQLFVLSFTGSFELFLSCRIGSVILQWIVTDIIARIKHGDIIHHKEPIDKETKHEVTKNIKAMFMHKIGGILVNTADSIIISAFIGIVILGKYSNYTTIVSAMMGVLVLCFTPLTSVIGHMFVEEGVDTAKRYFRFFHSLNFVLGIIFFLGYYATVDNLVTLLFGEGLQLSKAISIVITINYFVQFIKQASILFRDASGTFYYDRYKPLIEGLLNIGLSIGFVYLFEFLWGAEFAVVGVIVATIVTNLTICHVIEPMVLYKYAFHVSTKRYYIRNYMYIALFVGLLFALHFSMIRNDNQWVELFANGGISLAYSLTASVIVVLTNKDFRHYAKSFLLRLKRHKNNQPQPIVDINKDVNSDVAVETDGKMIKDLDNSTDT